MRRLKILPIACLTMLLSACVGSGDKPPASAVLPLIPADIRACFVGVVEIPAGRLTVGQVERLWKSDRVRAIAMRRCGARLIKFYDDLKANWR